METAMNAATIPTLPVDGLSHVKGRTDLPLSEIGRAHV